MINLIHGDCLVEMKKMVDKSVDLILTDPPYGIGISKNPFRQKHAKSDWDEKPMGDEFIKEIFRVSKHQIIWGGNYFDLPPTQCFYVWDKVQPEKFSSSMCEYAWCSRKSPAKLFRQRVTAYKKQHPTQKPLNLMEWCLGWFEDSATILDPFMGSGTTGVACKNLGRSFIGIEKDESYFNLAKQRIESHEPQMKLV